MQRKRLSEIGTCHPNINGDEESDTAMMVTRTAENENETNSGGIKSSSSEIFFQRRLIYSFWILGVLNNTGYVIMIAAAKSISEGGVGLVFLANILPALVIKGTAPYWFEKISYKTRITVATCLMVAGFALVASSSSLYWQLTGVATMCAQCALGEASLLALSGKIDGDNDRQQQQKQAKGQCLTGFSSGTGFAGVFGFFWKWIWNKWLGLSLSTTLWLATILSVGYISAYRYATYLNKIQQSMAITKISTIHSGSSQQQQEKQKCYRDQIDIHNYRNKSKNDPVTVENDPEYVLTLNENITLDNNNDDIDVAFINRNENNVEDELNVTIVKEISTMSGRQRFDLVLSLWPYMIPLFTVYVAEYTLQSGTWTVIGFPVTNRESRDTFYEYSNWMYQAGVFISRSSGIFFLAPMTVLWLMPILQVVNVGIYWAVAANQQTNNDSDSDEYNHNNFFYDPAFLYGVAFYTGLLGGAVYIHGYLRICKDLPLAHREFALSATSLAECLGIVVADFFGLIVQACLYHINDIDGAVIGCPSFN